MVRFFVLCLALLSVQTVFILGAEASGAKIDPRLRAFSEKRDGLGQAASVIVLMTSRDKSVALPRRYVAPQVKSYLRALARKNISDLRSFVATEIGQKGLIDQDAIKFRELYWINSSVHALVTPEGLELLARAPNVVKIYLDAKISLDRPFQGRQVTEAQVPYDVSLVKLDQLLSKNPALTGKGVVLGSVDTGVDAAHPALNGKILSFFDGQTGSVGAPHDSDSHGTHTIGTMIGSGKEEGSIMGMAKDAKMLAAGALSGYNNMLAGMQWMLDPDGNPQTNDSPRAVNNSWHAGGAPDMELFYRAISAWESASILPVFSAGNAGPGPGTITHPKEHPGSFSVAAIGPNGKAASFSSRGPGMFQGKPTQKPEIAAPGVDVLSSVPGGRYTTMSGTSMAAPHATGCSAILFQINPKFTPAQVRDVLIRSADAVDENGDPAPKGKWNAVYGFGKLNILAATELTLQLKARMMGFQGQDLTKSLITSPKEIDLDAIELGDADRVTGSEEDFVDVLAFPSQDEGQGWFELN